ncbi:MAG TPA: trehalase family glycosidase [Verrucomicrobiae bacterium]|nr:trehalase family glycosidase [Verrucomicrobiae bacterium]
MDEKQGQANSDQPTGENFLEAAQTVLAHNDHGTHTVPVGGGMYPHQWLWDSCFIAIGLSHYNVERAQTEILSLLGGQWANGMIPNIIHSQGRHGRDGNIWRSWLNPNAPDDVSTSGITQPPMVAEAVVRIGQKLPKAEKRSWYQSVFPALLAYHEWIYADRDPHGEGLALLVHPWETGLDNTPPWMAELHDHQLAFWITAIDKLHLVPLINLLRRDTHFIHAAQRIGTIDALALYSTQRRLRRKNYDTKRILAHSMFTIEDVTFNSILIRANQNLEAIAKYIRKELPEELVVHMRKTEKSLESLWDPYSLQYYSREFVSHRLLKVPSIGTLMPLYAGTVTKERAKQLVKMIENEHLFGAHYPIPTAPLNSEWFNPHRYWQGPTWVNTNWLIIDGLKRYGYNDHAEALKEATLEMVHNAGFWEYFSPVDGSPAGAENFGWTAALTIDLLKS